MNPLFTARTSVEQVESGLLLAPKFEANGLIPVVTTDVNTGEVLMHAYMNEEALVKTIETGEAHYYPSFMTMGQNIKLSSNRK